MIINVNTFTQRCDDEIASLQMMRIRNKGRATKFTLPLHPSAFQTQFYKDLFNRGYKTQYKYITDNNNIVSCICYALRCYNKYNAKKGDNEALYKKVFIEVLNEDGKMLALFPLMAIKLNAKGTKIHKKTFAKIVKLVKSNPYLDKSEIQLNFKH